MSIEEMKRQAEESMKENKPYTVEILVSVTVNTKSKDGAKKQATLMVGGRDGVNWTQVQSVREGIEKDF